METLFKYGIPCTEIKDIDIKKRIVQAYYFNSQTVDSDGDIIRPGAYAKSIAERGPKSKQPRIKHLFNHWDAAGVVMALEEDEKGGYFTSKLGKHTLGQDVLNMYEDGIITEHSHGFETINSNIATIDGVEVREITEGILWEVTSLDKWGANQNTPVIKSLDDRKYWGRKLDTMVRALEKGKYTDETFEILLLQLKQIQEIIKSYEMEPERLPTPPGAGNTTTPIRLTGLKITL